MQVLRALVLSITFASIFTVNARANEARIQEKQTPFRNTALFVPVNTEIRGGVVMLHGSEGGSLPFSMLEAQYLAAHGYVAMALCWYNCAKNPITSPFSALENVEIRNLIHAIEWIRNLPEMKGKKLALLGWSRGGELALILGSLPEGAKLLDSIAVHTPSDVVVPGFNWSSIDIRCWLCKAGDLTCFKNSEDPRLWDWKNMSWNPACGQLKDPNTMNAWLLDGKPLTVGSPIEIEKFDKSVFITVGDKDELWDYTKSVRVAQRLEKAGKDVEFHLFPNERHVFSREGENKRHELLLKFLSRSL